MFTNEFDWDKSVTTILDETADLEDVEIISDDQGVYIRQFNEELNSYDLVILSFDMFRDLKLSQDKGEGIFKAM